MRLPKWRRNLSHIRYPSYGGTQKKNHHASSQCRIIETVESTSLVGPSLPRLHAPLPPSLPRPPHPLPLQPTTWHVLQSPVSLVMSGAACHSDYSPVCVGLIVQSWSGCTPLCVCTCVCVCASWDIDSNTIICFCEQVNGCCVTHPVVQAYTLPWFTQPDNEINTREPPSINDLHQV